MDVLSLTITLLILVVFVPIGLFIALEWQHYSDLHDRYESISESFPYSNLPTFMLNRKK